MVLGYYWIVCGGNLVLDKDRFIDMIKYFIDFDFILV